MPTTREGYVDTQSVRFHFARAGEGPSLLLLPGAGGWRLNFDAMLTVLAPDHTVYAVDPPGQGRTRILDRDRMCGADAIALSIGEFLDAVGVPQTAIVGHSWGGGFALRLTELQPDRVTRLALISPAGLDVKDVWEFRLARIPLLGDAVIRLFPRSTVRHMLKKSFAHRDRVPWERADELTVLMRSNRDPAASLRDTLCVERSVRWADTERNLDLVRVPVLLLWGSEDRYFPVRLIERFTAQLPMVEPRVVQGGGHSLHDDCPKETYALLRSFLRSGTGSAVAPAPGRIASRSNDR